MIVEGLVTTVDLDGKINVAPMGPIVEDDFHQIILRPFQPSTTFNNLAATRCGVFHVVDQVDVIAKAAIGKLSEVPPLEAARQIQGFVLQNCCRWFEFVVREVDASEARSRMPCTVIYSGQRRPFLGFNRARHAVLEAAIIATRVHLIPWYEIENTFRFLASAVSKTGGTAELDAFEMLRMFVWSKKEATT